MIEKKTVSQCITSDYCKGWNDAVDSIVRCKDCNHYIAGFCTRDINGRTNMFRMSEDDFCSCGERKAE